MMGKKVFGVFLALALLLSLFPAGTVMATEEEGPNLSGWLTDVSAPEQSLVCSGIYDQNELPTPRSSENEFVPVANAIQEAADHMKNRKSSFTVYTYMGYDASATEDDISAVGAALIYSATVHDGSPTGGDYLFLHLNLPESSCTTYYDDDGTYFYFKIEFSIKYYTTSYQENTVTSRVSSAIADLKDKNDYEKLQGIHAYICKNVKYDSAGVSNDSDTRKCTVYGAIVEKSAIDPGYAGLFYRMALELGLDCRMISGMSGNTYHVWNIVKLDGKYYNVDTTTDAALSQNGQPYACFLRSNAGLGYSRDEAYNDSEFTDTYPMGSVDYTQEMADKWVALTAANFPCEGFRDSLRSSDRNGDNWLSYYELAGKTSIVINNPSATVDSLEGIEHLFALTDLHCWNTALTEVDLSRNPTLTGVSIVNAPLTELDVSALPNLIQVEVSGTQITELDVSGHPELENVYCQHNPLSRLDVSDCPKLTLVNCIGNRLYHLETDSPAMTTLITENNVYTLQRSCDRTVDLTAMPQDFDLSRVTGWTGGTVSGTVLTLDATAEAVSYTYDCGSGMTGTFTLDFTVAPHVYADGYCTLCGEEQPPYTLGDVDENHAINILDVMAMINIITGSLIPSQMQTLAADMDCSGQVNILDVMALIGQITGST